MKKTILSIFSVFIALNLAAQAPVDALTIKNYRYQALRWVEEYAVFCRMDSYTARSDFYSLFDNKNVEIFNDYVASDSYKFSSPRISVEKYVDLTIDKNSFYVMETEVSNSHIENVSFVKDTAIIMVSFIKKVSFLQREAYSTSGSQNWYSYPERTYSLLVCLKAFSGKIKAYDITCNDEIEPFWVMHDGVKDYYVSPFEIHLGRIESNAPWLSKTIKKSAHDNKIVEFEYDTLRNAVGFGFAYGTPTVKADIDDYRLSDIGFSSETYHNLWVTYHRNLLFQRSFRVGFDIRLDYTWGGNAINAFWEEHYSDIDPDGSPYERIISVDNYKETRSTGTLSLPLGIRGDYLFSKKVELFLAIHFIPSFTVAETIQAFGDAFYRGYYDWLFDVTLDQSGIYDFGHYQLRADGTRSALSRFSYGASSQLGVSYSFMPDWAIEAIIQYNRMWATNSNPTNDYHISRTITHWQTLTTLYDSYMLQLLSLSIQVRYYF